MSERKSATVTVEMLGKIMDELAQKNLSHEPGRSEAESSCWWDFGFKAHQSLVEDRDEQSRRR